MVEGNLKKFSIKLSFDCTGYKCCCGVPILAYLLYDDGVLGSILATIDSFEWKLTNCSFSTEFFNRLTYAFYAHFDTKMRFVPEGVQSSEWAKQSWPELFRRCCASAFSSRPQSAWLGSRSWPAANKLLQWAANPKPELWNLKLTRDGKKWCKLIEA